MKPQVQLNLPGMQGMFTNNPNWQVDSMEWALPGGAQSALISSVGLNPALINQRLLRSWLGREVNIYDESAQAIWQGWIEEINLNVNRLHTSWSTQHLLSRVRARYPLVSKVLQPIIQWQYSEWAENAERLQALGAKEALINLDMVDAITAQQAAMYHLENQGQSAANGLTLLEEAGDPHLEIKARGWWRRLDWSLDGEEGALITHLPDEKSQQSLGISGHERLAQSFMTGADPFQLGHIWLRINKIGNPMDGLRVKICSDNAGAPGNMLSSDTVSVEYIKNGWQWMFWRLEADVELSPNTRYWLVAERSGALDNNNSYAVETDDGSGYAGGECLVWNGSNWVFINQDLRFCLMAVADPTELMQEVAEQEVAAGVLHGVQIWQESGLRIPRWRELAFTRRAILEYWLSLGSENDVELSALVNAQRVLEVFALPRMDAIPLRLGGEGSLSLSSGVQLPAPLDLLGRHLHLPQADREDALILRGLRWTKKEGLLPVLEKSG